MTTPDDLVRYGFARQGDTRPSCMYDGYWTPWHIAADRIAELQAEVLTLRNAAVTATERAERAEAEVARLRAASVPREPTRAMLEAIQSPELLRTFAEAAGFKCDYCDVATMNWRAMHDAAIAALEQP